MATFKIWMNGKLVPQAQAVLPVNSAAVFYATNVFEGLRAYWNEADGELYCFRLGRALRAPARVDEDDAHHGALHRRWTSTRRCARCSPGNELHEDIHMHLVAYVAARRARRHRPRPGSTSTRVAAAAVTEGNGLALLHHLLAAHLATTRSRFASSAAPTTRTAAWPRSRPRPTATTQPIFLNQPRHGGRGQRRHVLHGAQGPLVTPPITSDILESITRTTLIEYVCPGCSAWTSWSATSTAPSSTWPTRRSSAAAATRSRRSSRSTASRSATARSARSRSACSPAYMDLVRGADRATRSGGRRPTSPFTFERGGPRNGPPRPPNPEGAPGSAGACFGGAFPATRRTRYHPAR